MASCILQNKTAENGLQSYPAVELRRLPDAALACMALKAG